MPAPESPAVVVDGVSKAFRLPHERMHTLKERALHPFRRSGSTRLQALDDVSFAVGSGEFFGIVGRNGSGKSTLLKLMAGIYSVDQGAIYVDGRVSTFIELGVGFNPDLPARDNVLINGVMLGLTPADARARYDRVIDFAELREFEDLKLKNYSSGMHVRLAFSVMVEVDADVFLIDEVLAVGDAAFQQKCHDVFNRMRDERKTIVFVTHDMASVRRFCHRAVLLERGRITSIGSPEDVTSGYVDANFAANVDESGVGHEGRAVAESVEVLEAWWEDESGEHAVQLRQGRPCTFRARIRFAGAVRDPILAVMFENEQHLPLMGTSTTWVGKPTGEFAAGDEATLTVRFDLAFAPGRIYATPYVLDGHDHRVLERQPQLTTAVVTGPVASGGLVDLAHDVEIESPAGVRTGRVFK